MMKDKWQVLGDATQGEETAAAVIVAAGKGLRMGTTTRKQYLAIAGVPLLSRTLMVFNECPAIVRIIAVVPEEDLDYCAQTMSVLPAARKPLDFIAGGEKRQDSVYEGICAVDDPRSIVVVHDGVRPFVTESEIIECIRAARLYGAAVLGIPAQDTLKSVDDHGRIEKTIERSRIWLAQTPQAFECRLLKKAHEKALHEGFSGTDDASLVERLGWRIKMVMGRKYNIKITTPEDVTLAEALVNLNTLDGPK